MAFAAPVSCLMSPGAFSDLPCVPAGGVMCPGELPDTPGLGPPLLPAWASCEAIVAANSAAAQIASFFRVMRTPPLVANDQPEPPSPTDSVSYNCASGPDFGKDSNKEQSGSCRRILSPLERYECDGCRQKQVSAHIASKLPVEVQAAVIPRAHLVLVGPTCRDARLHLS